MIGNGDLGEFYEWREPGNFKANYSNYGNWKMRIYCMLNTYNTNHHI